MKTPVAPRVSTLIFTLIYGGGKLGKVGASVFEGTPCLAVVKEQHREDNFLLSSLKKSWFEANMIGTMYTLHGTFRGAQASSNVPPRFLASSPPISVAYDRAV